MSDNVVDTKPSPVDGDRIPDLIKIGEIPSEYGQVLQTDIIDPATSSQDKARFTLDRVAGFLHSNSKITLGIVPVENPRAFFPLSVGVGQLCRQADLIIGGKTVCSTQDFSVIHAYHSLFLTNENNKEREQYLSQRGINHAPEVATEVDTNAPFYGLNLGIDDNVVGGVHQQQLMDFQLNDATSAETISQAPIYSIYLSDLFPFLKTNQLPAFMINEPIHIDLYWTATTSLLAGTVQSLRACVDITGAVDTAYDIDLNELKLVYDSISYDGEVMEKYREQNKELAFSYVDYSLARRTGTQAELANLTMNIGGNGRLVSKVICGLQRHGTYLARSILKDATSYAPTVQLALNMRYNDRWEFNVDRSNPALLFHTTQQAEGQVPFVSRQEYSREMLATLTAGIFEGMDQSSPVFGLAGLLSWVAVRPNRGERINNKGIELRYTNNGLDADTYTLRVWIELVKVATIKDGVFDCYYA